LRALLNLIQIRGYPSLQLVLQWPWQLPMYSYGAAVLPITLKIPWWVASDTNDLFRSNLTFNFLCIRQSTNLYKVCFKNFFCLRFDKSDWIDTFLCEITLFSRFVNYWKTHQIVFESVSWKLSQSIWTCKKRSLNAEILHSKRIACATVVNLPQACDGSEIQNTT
jgi:hypothetical protein